MDTPYSPGTPDLYGPVYNTNVDTSFKLDEGFSEDTRSQYDNAPGSIAASGPAFEEWVMAQNEQARASKEDYVAYVISPAVELLILTRRIIFGRYRL